ncbi:hypothetical protein BGZ94_001364 [Podila epigama]|nr:hypothetical protein BGZ94_001364 [Podila epigama]
MDSPSIPNSGQGSLSAPRLKDSLGRVHAPDVQVSFGSNQHEDIEDEIEDEDINSPLLGKNPKDTREKNPDRNYDIRKCSLLLVALLAITAIVAVVCRRVFYGTRPEIGPAAPSPLSVCNVDQEEPELWINHFPVDDLQSLAIYLNEGVAGNIKVSISQDPEETDIYFIGKIGGSDPEMRLSMHTFFSSDQAGQDNRFGMNIFVQMEQGTLRRALQQDHRCVWLDMHIVLPMSLDALELIDVQSKYLGDVTVDLGLLYLFDGLIAKAGHGNIQVRHARVNRHVDLEAKAGSIEARVAANAKVLTYSSGNTDLRVATALWVEVQASSEATTRVYLTESYRGEISLFSKQAGGGRIEGSLSQGRAVNVTQESDHIIDGCAGFYWECFNLPRVVLSGNDTVLTFDDVYF